MYVVWTAAESSSTESGKAQLEREVEMIEHASSVDRCEQVTLLAFAKFVLICFPFANISADILIGR